MDLFVVQHLHIQDDGEEDVKFIGVYSSREVSEKAVERLRGSAWFSIDLHLLDQDNWCAGYISPD